MVSGKSVAFVVAVLLGLCVVSTLAQTTAHSQAQPVGRSLWAPVSPHGIPDATADRVLGQVNFTANSTGLSASTFNGPAGIALAPDNRLFVVDYGNNRVLSWPDAAAFQTGATADLVLGQPNFSSMLGATSASNLNAPESVAVDGDGNVWVADSYNMRIVRFSPPFQNGMNANLVLGQANFSGNQVNRGQSTPSNNGLWFPRGLAFDQPGRLYVADMYNHRVLRFDPPFTNGKGAALVIGQANFTSGTANQDGLGAKATGLWSPAAVALDGNDNLYVADRDNNRVLRFDAPLSNGMAATALFGQTDFTSESALIENCIDNPYNETATPVIQADTLSEPLDLAFNTVGDLLVSDICFHRILLYQDPLGSDTTADVIYGQADATSGERNAGNSQPTADTLANPLGLAVDSNATMYVADFENHRVLAYDLAVDPTPTAIASPTATATNLTPATATPTTTPTPTATTTSPSTGDAYESDDSCPQAKVISNDGTVQLHTIHVAGDTDWVKVDAQKDGRYLIEVQIPDGSPADSTLEIYTTCGGALSEQQDYAFTPGIRLEIVAPATGPLFLKLADHDAQRSGAQVRYELSVRQLNTTAVADSALILVAGSLRASDPIQPNIYNVTDAVRRLFINQGYTDERIQYLAPDTSRANVDGAATAANVENAIITWAASKLSNNGVLTLYVMDHGEQERIYLNKAQNEWVTSAQINQWLTQLESSRPGLKINIMIEACYSGSFVTLPDSLSKAGRLVVTSTNDSKLAWASAAGAHFSDHLLEALGRKSSLYTSFQLAQQAAKAYHPEQTAWLDGNGNGIPNEPDDYTVAAQRGFDIAGTLSELWPPFIAEVTGPTTVTNGQGLLRAVVNDDKVVRHVWAAIYPPTYVPPSTGDALVRDEDDLTITRIKLELRGDGAFSSLYNGFTEAGAYRVVFFAEDDDGLGAQPVTLNVNPNLQQLFLPLITR